jgi:hypothetical protein
MAKLTRAGGKDGRWIAYGGVLPRVCCDSTTDEPHAKKCKRKEHKP